MTKQRFWCVKDIEDGMLRPQAGIWNADGLIGKANKEEWDENLSKKKHFKGSTLVLVTLTELV